MAFPKIRCIVVVAASALPAWAPAQSVPAQASVDRPVSVGQVPRQSPTMPPPPSVPQGPFGTRPYPGSPAIVASRSLSDDDLAQLMKAQTTAIKAMSAKIDALETRISALETGKR